MLLPMLWQERERCWWCSNQLSYAPVLAAGRAYHRNGKDNYTKNRSPCQQENQIFSIFFLKALDQPLQLRAGEVVHPVAELARQVAGALLGQNGGEFVPTQ